MALMDRIYIEDFLQKPYPEQFSAIERVRTLRSSALNDAMISSKTKSAKKNIAKGKSTRKPKDPTKAATAALSKLSPEQIALIKKQFQ
jgi:hypothetical protein